MTSRHFALGLIILFSLVSTPFALAHDGVMFEFAPDPWNSKRHTVASAATPFQYFQPTSDFTLTGFDFWMDNTGSSGNIAFTLYDDQNAILGEKTITIASTGAITGGLKTHVDLDSGVSLSHLKVYSIQISSTLLGLGLYYSDRLTLLEHNLPFATEYSNGVAYLGSAPQSYTFKFALHSPSVSGDGESESPSLEEEPATPPLSPVLVAIQNARVVATTHNAVTISWTTTVAADSRMSVRQQANPLYVLVSTYDPTLELEHTLTVSSLTPSTYFFADLASLQDPNATTTLVTALSFNTTAAPPTPPTPPTPPVPPVVPPTPPTPPATPATPPTPPSPPREETPAPLPSQTSTEVLAGEPTSPPSGATPFPSGGSTNLPSPDIETGAEGSLTVSWNPGASQEPSNGYRVDIFNAAHQLVRTVNLPIGTYSYETGLLASEDHTVIVYANNNGVFTKIVSPVVVDIAKGIKPIIWFWIGLAAAVLATIGIAKFAFGREKTVLTPLE